MDRQTKHPAAIQFIVKAGAAIGAGGFWGLLLAIVLKQLLALTDEQALLFVMLPVTVVFTLVIWPKLPAVFGFDR